jgi:hypothetical protein
MKKPLLCLLLFAILFSKSSVSYAHPGRTDENGGHTDSSTGEYHYHHGYPAHDHYDIDGDGDIDCPYNFDNKTDNSSNYDNWHIEEESTQHSDNKENINQNNQEDHITFWEVINALLVSLLPCVAFFMFSSYFISCILFFFIGESKGCLVSVICGAVLSVIAYIWMVVNYLS